MKNFLSRVLERNPRWWLPIGFAVAYLIVMTLMRVILTVYQWHELDWILVLPGFVIGLLYDLAFYSYLLIPFVFYIWLMPDRLFRNRVSFAVTLLVLWGFMFGMGFVAIAEWLFWDEFKARFDFIAVDYLVYTNEVLNNVMESYPIKPILIGIGIVALLGVYGLLPFIRRAYAKPSTYQHRSAAALLLLIIPVAVFYGLDQGAHQFSKNRYHNELASNGPYQFIAAFRNNEMDFQHYYQTLPDTEAAALMRAALHSPVAPPGGNEFSPQRQVSATGAERPFNVVLVSIESLSADFLGVFGNKQSLTPNLDSLAKQSLFFTQLYATGSRTDRGLEAISLSVPPTPGRSLVKRPEQYGRYSIGTEFMNRHYDTAYFYGGRGYFDNMNAFFSSLGYRIVDQTDLAADEIGFSNAWGVSDEYVFKRILREADTANNKGQQFFYHFMTTSNHRPYTFPTNRIDLPTGSREAAVKYTDWAIGDFITQAKQHTWFDNTVFVFIADHCADGAGARNLDARKHHIPLLIYSPKHITAKQMDGVASQIDLAPTLLGLLNFNYESHFFGHDMLRSNASEERALIGNYQHLGLLQGKRMLYLKPRKGAGLIIDPLGAKPLEAGLTADDEALRKQTIAYYQAADVVNEQHLAKWQVPQPSHRD